MSAGGKPPADGISAGKLRNEQFTYTQSHFQISFGVAFLP